MCFDWLDPKRKKQSCIFASTKLWSPTEHTLNLGSNIH